MQQNQQSSSLSGAELAQAAVTLSLLLARLPRCWRVWRALHSGNHQCGFPAVLLGKRHL